MPWRGSEHVIRRPVVDLGLLVLHPWDQKQIPQRVVQNSGQCRKDALVRVLARHDLHQVAELKCLSTGRVDKNEVRMHHVIRDVPVRPCERQPVCEQSLAALTNHFLSTGVAVLAPVVLGILSDTSDGRLCFHQGCPKV